MRSLKGTILLMFALLLAGCPHPLNSTPVSNAGTNQSVITDTLVSLDGSGSSDADGDTLTYSWSFSSLPTGSSASLSDSTAVNPTFIADVDGIYIVSLVVNDLKENSAADTVTITASSATSLYTVGGDVNNLTGTVVLQNNGGGDLTMTNDGNFTFTEQADGATYAITVSAQPSNQTCTVTRGDGTVFGANVTDVAVVCTDNPPSNFSEWRLIKTEQDNYDEYVVNFSYDTSGKLIKMEGDYDNDGTIDDVVNFTYDTNGNLIKMAGNHGTLDYVDSYSHDTNGNLIKMERDDNSDGAIDWVETYTYDTNGNLIKMEEDNGNDGTIDGIKTYTYDINDNLIKMEYYDNNDGTIDVVKTYTYDTNGNFIQMEEDYNNDGTIDWVEMATYDTNGNIMEEEEGYGNGVVDQVTWYTWEKGPCWVGGLDGIFPESKGLICN